MPFFVLARRAGFKLLAAAAILAASVVVYRFGVLPAIEWGFAPSEGATALLRRAGTLAFVVLGYAGYVRWLEKRSVTELRLAPGGMLAGAVAGMVLISITTATLFGLGYYVVTAVNGWKGALAIAGTIWTVAMFEEVVFRGVLFRVLEETCGTWTACLLQSVFFGAIHLFNIDADPVTVVLTFVGTALVGAVWTCLFVTTRNLWVCGAHHAAWNFGIAATGAPLSGLEDWRALVPVQSVYQGPVWITGGEYGPEASVLCIGVTTLTVAALVLWAKRKPLPQVARMQLA